MSKYGPGTLLLTGTNTYTGSTAVNAGTLDIGPTLSGGTSSGTVSVANNATLALYGWSPANIDALRSNANVSWGSTSFLGIDTTPGAHLRLQHRHHPIQRPERLANTLTLTGLNSYNGGTTVAAGTLEAAGTGTLADYDTLGAVVVQSVATLAVNYNGTIFAWQQGDVGTLLANATFNSGSYLGFDSNGLSDTSCTANFNGLGLQKLGVNALTLADSSGTITSSVVVTPAA